MSDHTPAATEAVVAACVGGALAGAASALLPIAAPLALPLAVAGAANGAVSGWRGIYDWRSPKGVLAFALDSTWALPTTVAGLAAHVGGALRGDAGYNAELSRRQNRHVYGRGLQIRKGFAVTFGNVVSGAGDLSRPRRAKLITDHEDVHVWQARAFGPAYPVLYAGWAAGGAVAGAATWALVRRDERLAKVVESCAYYLNPFEWWAYSRDDHWPPSGLVSRLGWRKPAVRSFASVRG